MPFLVDVMRSELVKRAASGMRGGAGALLQAAITSKQSSSHETWSTRPLHIAAHVLSISGARLRMRPGGAGGSSAAAYESPTNCGPCGRSSSAIRSKIPYPGSERHCPHSA